MFFDLFKTRKIQKHPKYLINRDVFRRMSDWKRTQRSTLHNGYRAEMQGMRYSLYLLLCVFLLGILLFSVSDTLTSVALAISHETPGKTDLLGDSRNCINGDWCGYLQDPDITFASYAVAYARGGSRDCTGTFIGPNVLLTAAHCGHTTLNGARPGGARTFQYRDGRLHPDIFPPGSVMSCEFLVQTLLTDTMLYYCDDVDIGNSQKLPPGILFGYLDFNPRELVVGEQVERIWWNPITTLSGWPNHLIYGSGRVTNNQAIYGQSNFTRIDTDIWHAQGGSGAVVLDPGTRRIVVGPAAIGGTKMTEPGKPGAYSVAIKTTLENMTIDASNPIQVNQPLLSTLNLISPGRPVSSFGGLQDKDGNYLFDVQELLEVEQGEKFRDHYWLGFESQRRNALWKDERNGTVDFQALNETVHLLFKDGGTDIPLITHQKLVLGINTTYRVSVMVYTFSADDRHGLKMELLEGGSVVSSEPIETVSTGAFEMDTFYLSTGTGGTDAQLRISANGNVDALLAAISLIQDSTALEPKRSSVMNFDTHDKRVKWRNDMNGARAFILPEGRPSPIFSEYSWAGLVRGTTPAQTDWSLRSRQMAFIPGEKYRLCFWNRMFQSTGPVSTGVVRVKDGGPRGTSHVEEAFIIYPSWTRSCTFGFSVKTSNNILQFGHLSGTPAYLVDDIQLEKL